MPKPLVSPGWLLSHLLDPAVAIIDCRFSVPQPEAGRERYNAGHIPGAVYFDLDRDLAGPQREHGGRHPLPELQTIAGKLGAAGVGEGVSVVVYDDSGESAARCWWLLRYLGHAEVAVMNGGFPAWQAAGGPVTKAPPAPGPRRFQPRPQPHMVATMAEVRDRPAGTVVVDARSPGRFAGEPHPLDARPGHIPGAVNRFWQEALAPDGTYKPGPQQAERLADLRQASDLIMQCGSGVTACANLLALAAAGFPDGRLYVGSWSDWCSYPENPVER